MVLRKEVRAHARGGFTLMEMLVVVAILVVLAGAAVPIYMQYLDDAKVSRARIDVKMLTDACNAYKLKYGEFPQNLGQLIQPPDGAKAYMEPTALVDPWNREYQYNPEGPNNSATGKPDIWSTGPKLNDPNSMIGNWTGH